MQIPEYVKTAFDNIRGKGHDSSNRRSVHQALFNADEQSALEWMFTHAGTDELHRDVVMNLYGSTT